MHGAAREDGRKACLISNTLSAMTAFVAAFRREVSDPFSLLSTDRYRQLEFILQSPLLAGYPKYMTEEAYHWTSQSFLRKRAHYKKKLVERGLSRGWTDLSPSLLIPESGDRENAFSMGSEETSPTWTAAALEQPGYLTSFLLIRYMGGREPMAVLLIGAESDLVNIARVPPFWLEALIITGRPFFSDIEQTKGYLEKEVAALGQSGFVMTRDIFLSLQRIQAPLFFAARKLPSGEAYPTVKARLADAASQAIQAAFATGASFSEAALSMRIATENRIALINHKRVRGSRMKLVNETWDGQKLRRARGKDTFQRVRRTKAQIERDRQDPFHDDFQKRHTLSTDSTSEKSS